MVRPSAIIWQFHLLFADVSMEQSSAITKGVSTGSVAVAAAVLGLKRRAANEADASLAASLRDTFGPDYHVRYFAMPDEAGVDYQMWKTVVLQELQAIGEDAIMGALGRRVVCSGCLLMEVQSLRSRACPSLLSLLAFQGYG